MPGFRLPWKSRSQVTSEVEEELRYHIDQVAAGLRAGGMSEAEAMAEAERRFGDLEGTRTYCRDQLLRREKEKRRMTVLDELRQDLHYAVRALPRVLQGGRGVAAGAAAVPGRRPDRPGLAGEPVHRDGPGRGVGAQLQGLAGGGAGARRGGGGSF